MFQTSRRILSHNTVHQLAATVFLSHKTSQFQSSFRPANGARGREMKIKGWDWCGRHGGAFIWPVASGDKTPRRRIALRPRLRSGRARTNRALNALRCRRNIRRIYIPVGTFFCDRISHPHTANTGQYLGPVWQGFSSGFRSCLEPFSAKRDKIKRFHR